MHGAQTIIKYARLGGGSTSILSHSAECGTRWTRIAAGILASLGLLWVVAHFITHMPTGASQSFDADGVSIAVETPRERVVGITRAAAPDGYVEWIVASRMLRVRNAGSPTSHQIGAKNRGAIVIGEKKGRWLKLAQEKGWMVIVMTEGHHFLRSRKVNYYQVHNGTCNDMAAFSIYDKDVCLAAAGYLGCKTSLGNVETYQGKPHQPQGCYAKGNRILFVPDQASCGHDGCSKHLDSWEPICSSGFYPRWLSGIAYMDSSAIATRVAMNEKQLAVEARNAPTNQCMIFWPISINDFVRLGFGASIAFFAPLRAYIATIGCKFVVGKSFASHWKGTGFASFWHEELPDTKFQARWDQGGSCGGMFWMNHFKPKLVKCKMPPGFISDQKMSAFLRSPQFNGWYSQYLQSFGPRIAAYRLPYNHAYAALHVRRGDKKSEIPAGREHMFQESRDLESVLAILSQYWPHITSVFIATDDSNTVEQAARAVRGKYNITWSMNAARYPGGSPMAQFEDHANSDGAVNGVLDDQAGLASASVLIGGSDSNFFNVAKALNVILHKGMPRQRPWCYNLYHNKLCR